MNFGDLFDSPWKILIIAVVLIILFGGKKMPDAARSLGRSMRILKAEVHDLRGEHDAEEQPEPVAQPAPALLAPQQQQIDLLQQQIRDLQRAATMDPAPAGAAAEPQRSQPS